MPTSQLLLYPLAINFNILSWQLSDKNHPAIEPKDTWVQIPWDLKIPWEGSHSTVLARITPWAKEPGRL